MSGDAPYLADDVKQDVLDALALVRKEFSKLGAIAGFCCVAVGNPDSDGSVTFSMSWDRDGDNARVISLASQGVRLLKNGGRSGP